MKIYWIALVAGALLAAPATADARQGAQNTRGGYEDPAQILSPRTSDRQVQQVLTRLRSNADDLRRGLDRAGTFDRVSRGSDDASYLVDDLLVAADHLNDHVARRQVLRLDVDDVLRRGSAVNAALQGLSGQGRAAWARVSRDLDALASAYGVQGDWRTTDYGVPSYAGTDYEHLTGTYALDVSRSDDPRAVADRALRQMRASERTRLAQQVYARLDAPELLAIDRRGDRVTIASSLAREMTFTADGRPQVERDDRGGPITTRATVFGDRLEVHATGAAGLDYTATFEPLDNGRSLRLTRELFDASLRQPIVVESVYRRTANEADWNLYDGRSRDARADRTTGTRPGASRAGTVVPDGAVLVAVLDQDVSTRAARRDDRVTLTMRRAPRADLEGAVIEGYLVGAPSRINGRTGVSIDFNEIRLRNNQRVEFAGVVESVRGPNGESVVFDADQPDANPNARRDEAIERGAIGAAIGAIIGAVAGGGKGAAIGAVIGGGGGAATVYVGQEDGTLPRGTEFTIRARAPRR